MTSSIPTALPAKRPPAAAIRPRLARWVLAALALLALCDIAAAGGLVYFFAPVLLMQQDLRQNGVTTSGVVTGRRVETDHSIDPPEERFLLLYEFQAGGTTVRKEEIVSQDIYDAHPTGSPARVIYAPANPENAMLERSLQEAGASPALPLFITCFFGAGAVGTLWVGRLVLKRVLQARRLQNEGIFTQGVVVSSVGQAREEGSRFEYVTYRFQLRGAAGEPLEYQARQMMTEAEAAAFKEGETVPVKYLQSDPNISRIVLAGEEGAL